MGIFYESFSKLNIEIRKKNLDALHFVIVIEQQWIPFFNLSKSADS